MMLSVCPVHFKCSARRSRAWRTASCAAPWTPVRPGCWERIIFRTCRVIDIVLRYIDHPLNMCKGPVKKAMYSPEIFTRLLSEHTVKRKG